MQVLEHLALSEQADVPPQHMLEPDAEGLSKARAEVEHFKVGARLVWHAGSHPLNTIFSYQHITQLQDCALYGLFTCSGNIFWLYKDVADLCGPDHAFAWARHVSCSRWPKYSQVVILRGHLVSGCGGGCCGRACLLSSSALMSTSHRHSHGSARGLASAGAGLWRGA